MTEPLKVLDLFSGIGGFSLGLERTGGFKTIAFVEIDNYCQRVLKKHWPEVYLHSDIRTLTAANWDHFGYPKPDVLTGGFPCQDISIAGKRAGIDGERSGLWSEYARLIGELRPRYAIVENVAALLQWGMERVLGDLAQFGYDSEWMCLPAGRFGAHHRRERIFIVAHCPDSIGLRLQGVGPSEKGSWSREQFEGLVQAIARISVPAGRSGGISHGVPHRVQRLHALGNSIVPQIATWIGERILEAERGTR
jgi:DNA (cytosine-5)-methyltransferase 1